jgi:gas vesicle structural protein
MAIAQQSSGYLARPGGGVSGGGGLAEVIDIILDKGLVIDAYVRVSLIGIEILTIDARIVIASVDTYLRFAEAVGRLDIQASDDSQGLPELMEGLTEGGASSKTKGALAGAKEAIGLGGDDDDDDSSRKQRTRSRRTRSNKDDE